MLEAKPNASPSADRRTRRKEGRSPNREVSVRIRGKWPGNEVLVIIVRRGTKLRGRVVPLVEQIIDLHEKLRSLLHLVVRSKVHDGIARRKPLPEVVDAVGLIQIVFVASREGPPHGIEVQIRRDFRGGLVFDERLDYIPGDLRDAVAGLHGYVAIESQTSIIGAIPAAVNRLGALVGGVQKRVIASDREMLDPAAGIDFQPLAPRLAEVSEIAEARLLGCDEQKIVVVLSPEPTHVPVQVVFERSAHTGFQSPGDHLFERRIADQGIRQVAGFVGIGTSQFDGRRRAARFAVAEIRRGKARNDIRETGRRIKATENVLTIEGSTRSIRHQGQTIDIVYGSSVVAARNRECQRLAYRERVGGIQTEGVDEPVKIDARIHRNTVLGGAAVRECADGNDREMVGTQVAKLRTLLEDRTAAIPGRTRRDVIVRDQPARLSRETVVVLLVKGVIDEARAVLNRFALLKSL